MTPPSGTCCRRRGGGAAARVAVICGLAAIGIPRPAAADALTDFLSRLSAAGKRTRTLSARFVQRKRLALFRSEVVSKGLVYFKQPDQLRWETFAPDAAVVLMRRARVEVRVPGEAPRVMEVAQGGVMEALVGQVLVWFGVRPGAALTRENRVTMTGRSKITRVKVVPTAGPLSRRVAAVQVEVDVDLSLRQIEIRQKDGDSTVIEFSGIVRNGPLPAKAFE